MAKPTKRFDSWYAELQSLARKHGINVADVDAWEESYATGIDPWQSLTEDYPELLDIAGVPASFASLDPTAIADTIGIPLVDWPGNCYGIACKMIEHSIVKGRPAYGHYLGDVQGGTLFYGRSLVRHGWILTPEGGVIDPTRWVFEGVSPYVYESPVVSRDYDEGGNEFLLANQKPVPTQKAASGEIQVPPEQACPLIADLLGREEVHSGVSMAELCWLATMSLLTLKERAKPLYEALRDMGCIALIPIDNRRKVLSEGTAVPVCP